MNSSNDIKEIVMNVVFIFFLFVAVYLFLIVTPDPFYK